MRPGKSRIGCESCARGLPKADQVQPARFRTLTNLYLCEDCYRFWRTRGTLEGRARPLTDLAFHPDAVSLTINDPAFYPPFTTKEEDDDGH